MAQNSTHPLIIFTPGKKGTCDTCGGKRLSLVRHLGAGKGQCYRCMSDERTAVEKTGRKF